ncbi:Protein of unknown function DUF2510 [Actinobacteria bacterium OK074]|nr:Protein of unknown function DUF2510 [Actinobacteria bacterium OK074]
MTQVTPPGWYPDPGQTSDGPATERWWDGKTWTDRTRAKGSATVWGPPEQEPAAGTFPAAAPEGDPVPDGAPAPDVLASPDGGAAPATPAWTAPDGTVYPAYPATPPVGGKRRMRTGIAVGVAAAVLVSIGIGAYALTRDGGDSNTTSAQGGPGGGQAGGGFGGQGGTGGTEGQGGTGGSGGLPFGQNGGGSSGGQSPAPGQSAQPQTEDGYALDALDGISIKVPDGWTGQSGTTGAQVSSSDSYKCPGDTSSTCTAGGAYSTAAVAQGLKSTTAEAAAKEDIAANAKESYGGAAYGGISSHEVLASEAVTVAGQKGYMVRWKAVTKKGADGYVESLVFPAPGQTSQLVVVRFGIDANGAHALKLSVLDTITKGIKAASGSGSGSNV